MQCSAKQKLKKKKQRRSRSSRRGAKVKQNSSNSCVGIKTEGLKRLEEVELEEEVEAKEVEQNMQKSEIRQSTKIS